jgi:hypothetical protein
MRLVKDPATIRVQFAYVEMLGNSTEVSIISSFSATMVSFVIPNLPDDVIGPQTIVVHSNLQGPAYSPDFSCLDSRKAELVYTVNQLL